MDYRDYSQGFFITEKVSNNAFNFERRRQQHGKKPQIYVPPLKKGALADLNIGQEIVFEDFDDNGTLQSCRGLEYFLAMSLVGVHERTIPVYIFDNHNHAFYFWCLEFTARTFQSDAFLIHVDQHKDNRQPENFLTTADVRDLEKVFRYTNTVLNVGNFIPPALEAGLWGDVFFVDSQHSIENLQQRMDSGSLNFENMVLDIDLDFFAPEFDYIGNNLQIGIVRKLLPKARMVTVATSPFFIEQERALKFLGRIFEERKFEVEY